MKPHHAMALLCLGLFFGAGLLNQLSESKDFGSEAEWIVWNGFLLGLPVILGLILLSGMRWAFMAGVIYGTIGLALDIATIVQSVVQPSVPLGIVALSAFTGLLNFLLVVYGGRGFLKAV